MSTSLRRASLPWAASLALTLVACSGGSNDVGSTGQLAPGGASAAGGGTTATGGAVGAAGKAPVGGAGSGGEAGKAQGGAPGGAGAGGGTKGGAAGAVGMTACPATGAAGKKCSGDMMCSYKAACCACGCDQILYTCKNGVFEIDGYADTCAQCMGGGPGGAGGKGGASGAGGKAGSSGATTCGPGMPACSGNQYCHFEDGLCGKGAPGLCTQRPLDCPPPAPKKDFVCGCDGSVYDSWCQASGNGMDLSVKGGCEKPAGTFTCGDHFCVDGAEYCERMTSDVGNVADSFVCQPLPPCTSGPAPACACLAQAPCGSICMELAPGNLQVTCPGG